MKKFFVVVLVLGILLVFAGTAVFLYRKAMEEPVIFSTTTPFYASIVKKTVATGSIIPRKEINIKPNVSGIVEKVFIEPGQSVKLGDIIAEIRIVPNLVNLNNAETSLKKAEINLQETKREMERQQKLYDQKIIAEAELQRISREYRLAREEFEAAENNLELVRKGASRKAGQQSNIVRSTVNGMVIDVPVKEGSSVIESNTFNEGTTIATIADMNNMIFQGRVNESEVGKISEGMDLMLSIGAMEKDTLRARLEYISPKGVEDKGAIQFQVKAAVIPKEGTFIRAGYSANADIVLARRDKVLALQEANLVFKGDTVYAEVETAPQQFEKRRIKTGISDGINVEILSGLTIQDKIKIQDMKNLEKNPG
jgi:HlyD family secretion protein